MRIRARRVGAPFDSTFFTRDPLFTPIAPAAARFSSCSDWPSVADYNALFLDTSTPAARFVPARPRGRRPRQTRNLETMYDAAIVRRREIPTRARNWHDYLNALVWATFPEAKLALHHRQHQRILEGLGSDASRLPPARTRELDTLAILDEGGVLAARKRPMTGGDDETIEEELVIFGHALFEALVLGESHLAARMVSLTRAPTESLDAALARALADPTQFLSPSQLAHIKLTPTKCAQ